MGAGQSVLVRLLSLARYPDTQTIHDYPAQRPVGVDNDGRLVRQPPQLSDWYTTSERSYPSSNGALYKSLVPKGETKVIYFRSTRKSKQCAHCSELSGSLRLPFSHVFFTHNTALAGPFLPSNGF